MNSNWFRKLGVLAGAFVVAASSSAAVIHQGKIAIVRSKETSLNVRFSGANVALVEIRLNGQSIGTRKLAATQNEGELGFELDLAALHDGDNQIEVRLFDADGKMVGSESTTLGAQAANGPIYLTSPKPGATVNGAVEINVGFGRDFKNVFVSFFVDNQFRAMVNSAPYSFIWDTRGDANGWHEVEAWVVDENSNTLKTKKAKIMVNNPGGRTDRVVPKATPVDVKPIGNPTNTGVSGAEAGLKAGATSAAATAAMQAAGAAPTIAVGRPSSNPKSNPQTAANAGIKVGKTVPSASAGAKLTLPTIGSTAPKISNTQPIRTLPKVSDANNLATTTLSIAKGTRLPNVGTYAILLNAKPVKFDVMPRVVNGIPLTPFRHLFEEAGGEVKWDNLAKSVAAQGMGKEIWFQVGSMDAKVNSLPVKLEVAPFIERGRTVVPLSFIRESLNVEVEYDAASGHVLITRKDK